MNNKFTKYLKPCVIVAAISSCIQSCVFIGVTIFGIVIYLTCEKTNTSNISETSNSHVFGQIMKAMYFLDEECIESLNLSSTLGYLTPYQLLVWQGIVLGLSILWILFSVILVSLVDPEKPGKCLTMLHVWVYYTVGICTIDLTLGILFGLDLKNISKNMNLLTDLADPTAAMTLELLAIMKAVSGILMTVVLRGYLLWILNISFAIYFFMCVCEIHKNLNKPEELISNGVQTRQPINAYEQNRDVKMSQWTAEAMNMERPHLVPSRKPNPEYFKAYSYYGDVNPAFVASNENLASSRSTMASSSPVRKDISAIPPWQRSALKKDQREPSPDYSPPMLRKNQTRQQY